MCTRSNPYLIMGENSTMPTQAEMPLSPDTPRTNQSCEEYEIITNGEEQWRDVEMADMNHKRRSSWNGRHRWNHRNQPSITNQRLPVFPSPTSSTQRAHQEHRSATKKQVPSPRLGQNGQENRKRPNSFEETKTYDAWIKVMELSESRAMDLNSASGARARKSVEISAQSKLSYPPYKMMRAAPRSRQPAKGYATEVSWGAAYR